MKKTLIIMILALVIFFSGTVFFAQTAKAQSFNIGLRGGIVLQDVTDENFIGDMPKILLGFSSDMFTLDFTYQWTGIRDWDSTPAEPFEHTFEADLGFSKAITDYFNFKAKSKLDIVIYGDTADGADDSYVEYKYEIEVEPKFSMDIIEDLWNVTGLTVMKWKPLDMTGSGDFVQSFLHDKTEFINTFNFGMVSVNAGFVFTGWYWMASIDDGYYGLSNSNPENSGNMAIFPVGASADITLVEDMMSLSISGDVSLVVAPEFEPIVNVSVDLPMTFNEIISLNVHAGASLNLLSFGDDPVNSAVPAWRILIRAELGIAFPMATGDSEEEEENNTNVDEDNEEENNNTTEEDDNTTTTNSNEG